MADRFHNRISCKIALYTPTRDKVLVVESHPGKYSLPGGHMEEGETPDDAMRRELFEELGLRDITIRRTDFWLHESGKLILGYTGTVDEAVSLVLQAEEIHRAHWVTVEQIICGEIAMRSYGDFVVASQ